MEKLYEYREKFKNNRKWNGWRYGVPLFYIGVGIYIGCMLAPIITPIMDKHPIYGWEIFECVFNGFLEASLIYGVFMTIASAVLSIKPAPSIKRDPDIYLMQRHAFSFRLKWRAKKAFRFVIIRLALLISLVEQLAFGVFDSLKFWSFIPMCVFIITGIFTIVGCINMGTVMLCRDELEDLDELEYCYGHRGGITSNEEG